MNAEQSVLVVDDDADVRESLRILLQSAALDVQCFASARDFLERLQENCAPDGRVREGGCLILDISMPSMSGLQLQEEIARAGLGLPVIVLTGHGDVGLAVQAMKAGAVDFIEKPFDGEILLGSVERALEVGRRLRGRAAQTEGARRALAALTARERDVLEHLVRGQPNKVVAYELGISPRTVEIHRARIMSKLKSRSLSDLVRLALAAGESQPWPAREQASCAMAPPFRAPAGEARHAAG
jgi:two-component system response regulator FixJ